MQAGPSVARFGGKLGSHQASDSGIFPPQENPLAKDVWERAKKLTAEYAQPGPHLHMPYEEAAECKFGSERPGQSKKRCKEV